MTTAKQIIRDHVEPFVAIAMNSGYYSDVEMGILCDAIAAKLSEREDAAHKEVQEDHKRLVRDIDVLLNGGNAAQQASLCDLVPQIAASQKDAARYRWLRGEANFAHKHDPMVCRGCGPADIDLIAGEELDAVMDAAMQKEQP